VYVRHVDDELREEWKNLSSYSKLAAALGTYFTTRQYLTYY
jgi:hypothetical protein